jgi:AcrR family transcriptional regulator
LVLERTAPIEHASVRRILEAAGRCFGRKGYVGASMNEIAREAEVSKSLLHYHFSTKEQLFIQVFLGMCHGFLQRLESITAFEDGSLDQMQRGLDEVLVFVEDDLEQVGVILEFRRATKAVPGIADQVTAFHEEIEAIITVGLRRVLGPMTDRLALSVERLARLVLVHLQGTVLGLLFALTDEDRQRVRESYEDMGHVLARSVFREVV